MDGPEADELKHLPGQFIEEVIAEQQTRLSRVVAIICSEVPLEV